MRQLPNRGAIRAAADDTERADTAAKNALAAAKDGLRVAFVAPEALGGDQGRDDGKQLLDDPSKMSPEQLQRLTEAGYLSPEDLQALAAGQTVTISASQMEYLNAVARSLDGKTPQQIEALLSTLPPDAQHAVMNGMQLLSTDNVTASVRGDKDIPTDGALNLLPAQMAGQLTRPDRVAAGFNPVPGGGPYVALNGVAENQATARLAALSDPAFKHGTGLDTAIMNTARDYLGGQVRAENDHSQVLAVDGQISDPRATLTEPMFNAVADDKAVVAAAVTDGQRQQFLSDAFSHGWGDDGTTMRNLFQISPQDAVVQDPSNAADALRATHAADIAESVSHYMSDDNKNLLHLPDGAGGQYTTVGERNPELIQGLAEDLAPYYSTLAGSQSIPGVENFTNHSELARMYSVLASDPTAGVSAAQATVAQELALAQGYGAGDPAEYAQIAGQMQSGLEVGTQNAMAALNQGDIYRANWEAAVEGAKWDTAKAAGGVILGEIPGADALKKLVDVASPGLKLGVQGIVDPSQVTDPGNSVPHSAATSVLNSNHITQSIIDGLIAKDPSILNNPGWADNKLLSNDGTRIEIKNADAQRWAAEILGPQYGLSPERWLNQFTIGKNINGEFTVAHR
ncbi:hypothetical protein [Mycolicibacterium fortuitum]|uniref:TPR repeat region-containing protein n=1 Tax=Mycolicibacterium fortuitum TaxID=1766 RepID=UPI0026199CF2|nr:hypothetical protein [Mycolicibacterium fortuitum]